MLLRSLHVECLKTLRGPVDLEFAEGLTVIGGPNESGKSTLREALGAALFYPAGSTKKEVKDLATWGSSSPPVVRLGFRLQGEEWRVEKTFGRKKGGAALHRGDRLVAEDNDAQAQLDELLRGSGEADWIRLMWGEQGDVHLGLRTPPTLEARLHAAAGTAVSPQVDRLAEALEKEADKLWTPKTGKPRKAVQDARAEEEVAERAVADAEAALAEADRQAAEVRDLQARLQELEAQQDEATEELQRARESLQAWTAWRLAAERVDAARATADSLRAFLQRREALRTSVAELTPQAELEAARRAELEPLLASPPSRDAIDRLNAERRLLELLDLQAAREELQRLKAPTAEEMREVRKLGGAAAGGLQARIVAEVDLEARLKAGGFEAALGRLQKGEARDVSAPSQFELILPGIARIEVRTADGPSTSDLGALLGRYGLATADEAEERYARAEALRARAGAAVDPAELEALRQQVPDPRQRDTLAAEIAGAEAAWRESQQGYAEAQAELQKLLSANATGRLEAARAALEDHERNAPEDPEPRLEAAEAALQELQGTLERPEGEEVTPESLRQREEDLDDSRSQADEIRAAVNQQIGAVSAQGELYVRYVAAVENLARVRARVSQVNVDAYSIKLLYDTLGELRAEFEQDVVSPLQERLTQRFQELTRGRYLGVEVNRSQDVEGVVPREVERAPLEALSFGTQEQLSFLARLTLAELLGQGGERQFVIFDDNLVHTDDERMAQALRWIEEGARAAQVIVLTCHPERYRFATRPKMHELSR